VPTEKLTIKRNTVNESDMSRGITRNGVKERCLLDDPHSCVGSDDPHSCVGSGDSQPVSLIGMHQFDEDLAIEVN